MTLPDGGQCVIDQPVLLRARWVFQHLPHRVAVLHTVEPFGVGQATGGDDYGVRQL